MMHFLNRMHLSSNGQLIAKNVYWSLLSKVINMASALFVGILVARYLGPEQFGLMNYVVSYVSIFLILASFGFDNIEIREEAKNPEHKDKYIGTTFWLRIILSCITMVLIILTAIVTESDNYTLSIIALYALSVIFSSFDVIRNYFTSQVMNEYVAKVCIVRTLIACVLKLILVLLDASLTWFIAVLTFESLLQAQGFYVAYIKAVGSVRQWFFDKAVAVFMLKQSFPLLLSGAAAYIFLRIDQVMIGKMIDNASVGYFSVATKIVEILLFVPTIVIQTISPMLVKIKKHDERKYIERSQQVLNITVWASIIISIITSLLAYYMIIKTFGYAYQLAILPLQILSFKTIGTTLNVISGQFLIINGLQKYFVLRSLSGCIACIVLNMIIIPIYGVAGVCVIACVTQLIAGWIIHFFIPIYRPVFFMQCKSLLWGWQDLFKLKAIFLTKVV